MESWLRPLRICVLDERSTRDARRGQRRHGQQRRRRRQRRWRPPRRHGGPAGAAQGATQAPQGAAGDEGGPVDSLQRASRRGAARGATQAPRRGEARRAVRQPPESQQARAALAAEKGGRRQADRRGRVSARVWVWGAAPGRGRRERCGAWRPRGPPHSHPRYVRARAPLHTAIAGVAGGDAGGGERMGRTSATRRAREVPRGEARRAAASVSRCYERRLRCFRRSVTFQVGV